MNEKIQKPVFNINVVGPSDDNNEFIIGVDAETGEKPAIQFGQAILDTENGDLHFSGNLVVDGDVYTDGSDTPVTPGTLVEANPEDEATEELTKIKIDDTTYSIPEGLTEVTAGDINSESIPAGKVLKANGEGGASWENDTEGVYVEANPEAPAVGTLSKIQVINTVYEIPSNYVEKVTEASQTAQAYGKAANGVQLMYPITDGATPTTLITRDGYGRAKIATPESSDDIATKGYVDGLFGNYNNAEGVYQAAKNYADQLFGGLENLDNVEF